MTRYAKLKKDAYFFDPEKMQSFSGDILVSEGTIVQVYDWLVYTSSSNAIGFSSKILGYKLEINGLYSTISFEKAVGLLEFLND